MGRHSPALGIKFEFAALEVEGALATEPTVGAELVDPTLEMEAREPMDEALVEGPLEVVLGFELLLGTESRLCAESERLTKDPVDLGVSLVDAERSELVLLD
jgi:hypothetical protein